MRPGESEGMMGRDGEQIWLRQSATFTANGQTRTLEIALPLRPGATPEEIEALLREADGGMERLSRHLDARVAELRGETPPQAMPALSAPIESTPTEPAPLPSPPAARNQPAAEPTPAPDEPAIEPVEPASARREPPRSPASEAEPPATPRERAGLSLVREPPAAPQAAPRPPAPSAAPVSTAPLTLPEFLKAAQDEFGLTPRTVMEKLGVRSLSGVNYREALETLRRQALRDGVTPSTPAAPEAAPRASVNEQPRQPSAPQPPRYFEEELDEPEVIFGAEDDAAFNDEFGAEDEDDDDVLNALEFAEELAPPPPPTPPTRSASATRTRPAAQSQAPASPPAPPTDLISEELGRIPELIAQLRSAQAGGVPTSHQRTAYRNIVVQELGEEKAKALVAGLYRVTPERLGPEQIDLLLSWGKRDTFADDADPVLAALRAERAAQQASQASQANQSSPANPASAEPPTPRASRAPRA